MPVYGPCLWVVTVNMSVGGKNGIDIGIGIGLQFTPSWASSSRGAVVLDRTGVRFGAPLRAPVTHRTWHRHSSLGWAVGTDRAKKPQNRCSRDDQAKMQFDVDSCHIRKPKDFGFRFEASARFEATQILNIAPSLLGGVDGWWWVLTQKALRGTWYEHQYFIWLRPPPLSKRQNPVTAGWPPHCPTAAELSKRTWLASASASDTNHFVSGWGNSSDMFWALNGTLKDTKAVWNKVFQRCHSLTKRTSGLEWTSYGFFGCSLTIFWAICTSLRLWANSWGHNQQMDRSRLSSSSEGDAKWDIQVGSVFSMEYSPFAAWKPRGEYFCEKWYVHTKLFFLLFVHAECKWDIHIDICWGSKQTWIAQ